MTASPMASPSYQAGHMAFQNSFLVLVLDMSKFRSQAQSAIASDLAHEYRN